MNHSLYLDGTVASATSIISEKVNMKKAKKKFCLSKRIKKTENCDEGGIFLFFFRREKENGKLNR